MTITRIDDHHPPGVARPRRFVPRFHWELLVCGLAGHALLGVDAAALRPEDELFAREAGGARWYRCLRCDSWLPLPPPADPAAPLPPSRAEVELPLRGKALRDKIVLRLIAVDRAIHFVALAIIAAAVFLFASHEAQLRRVFYRIVNDVQGGAGGPTASPHGGFLHELDRAFTLQSSTLHVVGAAAAAYAVLEGAEAVGLWLQRRWAEYLTFVATIVLLPFELYELTHRVSYFKILALVVNLAIAVYLLLAKRLFGLRGGAEAERREREEDLGWAALERTAPPPYASALAQASSSTLSGGAASRGT